MKCPKCHYEVADSTIMCPVCFSKIHDGSPNTLITDNIQNNEGESKPVQVKQVVVKTINTNTVTSEKTPEVKKSNKKIIRKKTDYFFIGVILVGVIILICFAIYLFNKDNNNNKGNNISTKTTTTVDLGPFSENLGYHSTFNYPMNVGEITLASIYDKEKEIYTDVDVKGIRFIEGLDATLLASTYAKEPLNVEFEWIGFEYTVTLNDLEYLGDRTINPVLNPKIYKWNGCDFINYNDHNYILNVVSIYDGGNIKNKESATIKVLYQLPIGQREYSVCFGDKKHTMGCFSKW